MHLSDTICVIPVRAFRQAPSTQQECEKIAALQRGIRATLTEMDEAFARLELMRPEPVQPISIIPSHVADRW